MVSKDINWTDPYTPDGTVWRNTGLFFALLAGVPAALLWGSQLLGIATSEAAREHAREGIPLVATAFGAALVALALVIRQFDSTLEGRTSKSEEALRKNVAGRESVDAEATQIEDAEDERASTPMRSPGDQGTISDQAADHPSIRANELRQRHRDEQSAAEAQVNNRRMWQQLSNGFSSGLEISGAVLLLVAAIAAVALWRATAPN